METFLVNLTHVSITSYPVRKKCPNNFGFSPMGTVLTVVIRC